MENVSSNYVDCTPEFNDFFQNTGPPSSVYSSSSSSGSTGYNEQPTAPTTPQQSQQQQQQQQQTSLAKSMIMNVPTITDVAVTAPNTLPPNSLNNSFVVDGESFIF